MLVCTENVLSISNTTAGLELTGHPARTWGLTKKREQHSHQSQVPHFRKATVYSEKAEGHVL